MGLIPPASPDELVKHSSTVGALSQHHSAAVTSQQHPLEHWALQGEHQGVNLDHLHLVGIGRLHTKRNITSVPLNQQGLQALQQGLGVADGVAITASFLGKVRFQQACVQRGKKKYGGTGEVSTCHTPNTAYIQSLQTSCICDYLLGQIMGQYHENPWH